MTTTAHIADGLTDVQRKMVGRMFYIDGWHNRQFAGDAAGLINAGLASAHEGGDDQYTVVRYPPTELGLAVRAHLETNRG